MAELLDGAAPLREAAEDDAQAQAAQAARQALAAVLRQRADLVRDLDGEIARLVEQALARITAELSAAPSDYRLWVLPRLMDAITRVLDDLAATAGASTSSGLRQAWDLGTRAVDAPLAAEAAVVARLPSRLVPRPAVAPAPPATSPAASQIDRAPPTPAAGLGMPHLQQLRAMQHFSTGLIKGATTDTVNTINRALGQVVLGAAQPFDAIRTVAALLPERTSSQVRGIVTTNLNTAFNAASFARLQEQASRDPGLKKQWRRSGKRHSRANHDAADGQVQEVAQPFTLVDGHKAGRFVQLMHPGDPAAPIGEVINCGCVALAWKATWKMRNPGAVTKTAAELAELAAKARPKAAQRTPRKAKAQPSTQGRILAAFSGSAWRDVTGQRLVIDERLAPPGIGDARLNKPGSDLYSYTAVQALKRPSEIWQTERVGGDGQLIRERIFLKRFQAAGQQWLGQATFRLDGESWVPVGPYRAQAAGASADTELTAARAGARVWPQRR